MAFGRVGALGTGFSRLGAGKRVVSGAAVGGAALLTSEANGFAADFTYATDASRVAVKTAGTVVSSGLSFFTNAGASSKWVYNSAGTLVNVAAGSLAVDYDPVTHAARGLLCEPQATNLNVRSQELNSGWDIGSATVGVDATAAPDGTSTADAFIPSSGSVSPSFGNTAAIAVTTPTTYTYSMFAKNGSLGNNWLMLTPGAAANTRAWFNLATGAKGSSIGALDYTITSVGGGWYRVTVTYTTNGTNFWATNYAVGADSSVAGAITGNGTSPAFYIWGAQLEAGPIATSYIPTTGASVTRAADQVNVTPASIGHSATAGSWWAEWSVPAVVANGRIIGNTSASAPLLMNTNSVGILDGTTLSKSLTWAVNTTHKAASAYASGDRAVTLNGAAVAADAGAVTNLLAPGAAIYFGNGGSTPMNGWLRKVRYLPRRPTNGQMVTDTT